MGREMAEIGNLEEGDYIVVNEEPCQVTKMSYSATKDEDGEKVKVYAEGMFDGQKRNFSIPDAEKVEVPITETGRAQILAIIDNSAELMDLSSYETFELTIPLEFRGEIEEGEEVKYLQALGRKKIIRRIG